MNKRELYIDYIKAVGIILVIMGHINFANDSIKAWIYSFHMPVFFFASGLTLQKKPITLQYIRKKVKSLVVPYIIWACIYSSLSIKNIARLMYGSYGTIVAGGALSSLWFLPALFIGVIFAQIIINKIDKVYMIVCTSIILYIISILLPKLNYPWCFDVGIMASAFILFGHAASRLVKKYEHVAWKWIAVISFLGTFSYHFNPVIEKSYVLVATRRVGNPVLFAITAIFGCVWVLSLCKMFDRPQRQLAYIGRNSMTLFVLQKPVIAICGMLFGLISIPNTVVLIATTLITVIVCCIASMVLNYYAPCMVGMKNYDTSPITNS